MLWLNPLVILLTCQGHNIGGRDGQRRCNEKIGFSSVNGWSQIYNSLTQTHSTFQYPERTNKYRNSNQEKKKPRVIVHGVEWSVSRKGSPAVYYKIFKVILNLSQAKCEAI